MVCMLKGKRKPLLHLLKGHKCYKGCPEGLDCMAHNVKVAEEAYDNQGKRG